MNNINFVTAFIDCPRNPGHREKIEFRFVYLPENEIILSPFNGCEFMSGLPICLDCCNRENSFAQTVRSWDVFWQHYHRRKEFYR